MENLVVTVRKGFCAPKTEYLNSSKDRQNVSFKFSKHKNKALSGANKLSDEEGRSNTDREIITSIEGKEIKSLTRKSEKKPLVIPAIDKNLMSTSKIESKKTNNDELINDLALKELLKETAIENAKWEKREFHNYQVVIPTVAQKSLGSEKLQLDAEQRIKESNLDDYENVPIDEFGTALLRGLGCNPGDPIGNKNKMFVEAVVAVQRSKGLGLGADKKMKESDAQQDDKNELKLMKGAYIYITQGKYSGSYGQVEGVEETRVVASLHKKDENVSLPTLHVKVVSKKEFQKESNVINKEAYDNYKREQESKSHHSKREDHDDLSTSHKSSHRKRSYSPQSDRRKRSPSPYSKSHKHRDDSRHSSPSHRHSRRDEISDKRHKKRKHSKERHEKKNYSYDHEKAHSKVWICPQLRVRLIDKNFKKGKYFNQKIVIEDMLSPSRCVCKTDDGKYLEDISESMLETIVPRSEPGHIMIVTGKYKGQLGVILKRDKANCEATVQFLSDRGMVVKLDYDSICEYVGDISQFD